MTKLVNFSTACELAKRAIESGEARARFDARAFKPRTWDVDRIIYTNEQWAVTEYGVENVAGPYHYHIAKDQVRGEHWVRHMSEKNWVDAALFAQAHGYALSHFGKPQMEKQ